MHVLRFYLVDFEPDLFDPAAPPFAWQDALQTHAFEQFLEHAESHFTEDNYHTPLVVVSESNELALYCDPLNPGAFVDIQQALQQVRYDQRWDRVYCLALVELIEASDWDLAWFADQPELATIRAPIPQWAFSAEQLIDAIRRYDRTERKRARRRRLPAQRACPNLFGFVKPPLPPWRAVCADLTLNSIDPPNERAILIVDVHL